MTLQSNWNVVKKRRGNVIFVFAMKRFRQKLKIPKWLSESRKSKDRQINGQQKKTMIYKTLCRKLKI
jgi:hypothetical protein